MESLERRDMFTTFFVDADAAVSGNGATDSPFQTIQAAANVASPGDIIEVRGGVYRETVSVFDDNVTFRAAEGEEVILSGGDLVTGWTLVTGDANQDGVIDSRDDNIYRANVSFNAPPASAGRFAGNPTASNTLFVNGELRNEARQFAENDVLDASDWGQIRSAADLQSNSTTLTSTDLVGLGSADFLIGADILVQQNDFVFQNRTIVGYNPSTGTVTFDSPVGNTTNRQDNIFYIDGSIRFLDQAGEWFRDEDFLYYKAEEGQNPNDLEIEFRRRAFAFDVRGDDGVVIDGFQFRGASIQTDAGSDNQVYSNNLFYAYDFGQVGRFFVRGDNVQVIGNEFSNTATTSLTIDGTRVDVVNNYFHDIGIGADPTTRALTTANATELFFSHNTVRRFARSVFDGYAVESQYSNNLFEDGGLISYDTGVFDSDGTNGNTSFSRINNNVFRNFSGRGIFTAFYGRNNNVVIDHNIIYNFEPQTGNDEIFENTGIDFRQVYHNTIISARPLDGRDPDLDSIDPSAVIQTRYNNNLQIDIAGNEQLGVDLRGNFNFTAADFVDFDGNDFRLAAGSGAIDAGIEIPGINDGFSGVAPDAGAIEFGEEIFDFGHDFDNPPTPVFSGEPLPGTNLDRNSQFNQGLQDYSVLPSDAPLPRVQDFNSFNLRDQGNSLTDSVRTQSVEFEPGTAIRRTFSGLEPNTTYTLGAAARVIDEVTVGSQFDGQQGSVSTGSHRGLDFVANVSGTDFVRYDGIDFGDPGQYDLIEFLYTRANPVNSIDGVTVQIRVDSPTGPLLAEFTDFLDDPSQMLFGNRESLADVSGTRSIFVSASGANAANLAIGNIRLLQENLPAEDLLTAQVVTPGGGGGFQELQFGWTDWQPGFDTLEFTTGSAGTAVVTFRNDGRISSYLDRTFLLEGSVRQGDNLAFVVGEASQSSDASTDLRAANAIDQDTTTLSETLATDINSYLQVQFSNNISIGEIELFNRDDDRFAELSNFTVSVYDGDPEDGATQVWSRSYFEDGSVSRGGSLRLDGSEVADDGVTRLGSAFGRVVRVQLNGLNNEGNGSLALADLTVRRSVDAPSAANLAFTSTASQSTNLRFVGDEAADTINGIVDPLADFSHTQRESGAFLQLELEQVSDIGQIVVVNRGGENNIAGRIGSFRVSVWDADPDAGGSELWGVNSSFDVNAPAVSTTTIGNGGALRIDGNRLSNGLRLDEVEGGRYVRVQLLGNNFLHLAEVQVWRPNQAVDLDELVYTYDLGTDDQVFAGATAITPGLAGDAFFSGDVTAIDRGVGNAFNRDFIAGTTPATFNHRVENGRYRVTLNTSDPQNDLDNLFVRAENGAAEVTDIDRPAGENQTFNLIVDVDDGELNLEFGDADLVNPEWAVNRIVLTRISSGAPVITPDSGAVAAGTEVIIQNPDTAGDVFFTLDGTDPILPDGSISPSAVSATPEIVTTEIVLQDFEGVTTPNLPAGFVAATTNPASTFTTTNVGGNIVASINNIPAVTDATLTSSPFSVESNSRRISFQNSFSVDAGFDGGLLEYSVNGSDFNFIPASSFVEGGYNGTISTAESNPIGGNAGWTGSSGGFITTTFDLPADTIGNDVQLRWRFGSGSAIGGVDWQIDDIVQLVENEVGPNLIIDTDTTVTARTVIGDEVSPLSSAFLQVDAGGLTGDFNNDTAVNVADFVVFRDFVGSTSLPANETASPGVVDAADFDVFVGAFGQPLSAPAVAAALSDPVVGVAGFSPVLGGFAQAATATTTAPELVDAAVLAGSETMSPEAVEGVEQTSPAITTRVEAFPPLAIDEAVADEAIADSDAELSGLDTLAATSLLSLYLDEALGSLEDDLAEEDELDRTDDSDAQATSSSFDTGVDPDLGVF